MIPIGNFAEGAIGSFVPLSEDNKKSPDMPEAQACRAFGADWLKYPDIDGNR